MKARFMCLVIALGYVAPTLGQSVAAITVRYGSEPTSFGELRVPAGEGPFPVAVLIHGGCWRSDRGSLDGYRPMAMALQNDGVATWNIEYRRVGHEGGGWPGTFLDLGEAIDRLATLDDEHRLDLASVVLVGHSSGGYFAAWLAARHLLPQESRIRGTPSVEFAGAVLADAYIDPLVIDSTGVDGAFYCGEPLLERLLGGTPEANPERLRQISPLEQLPWRLPQEFVVSSRRYPVVPPRPLADGRTTMEMLDYPALARAAGDEINVEILDDAEHMSFMMVGTDAFEAVRRAVLRLLAP